MVGPRVGNYLDHLFTVKFGQNYYIYDALVNEKVHKIEGCKSLMGFIRDTFYMLGINQN